MPPIRPLRDTALTALTLNVVVVANAAAGPRDLVNAADIVVEVETRSMALP